MEVKEMYLIGTEGFKVKTSRVKPAVEKEGKEEEKETSIVNEVVVYPSDHFGLVGKFEMIE